jgi:hypothetical protein
LEQADRDTAKLALRTLAQLDVAALDMKLAELLGSTSDAAEWVMLDFPARRTPGPDLLAALEERMPDLTFIGKHKVKLVMKDNP